MLDDSSFSLEVAPQSTGMALQPTPVPKQLIPFSQMKYHPTSEKLVKIICDKAQRDDPLFFRIMVAYYFSVAAAQMRCAINTPDRGVVPVNTYVLNLAPTGYGKTLSANILEGEVLHLFRNRFLNETFPILAEANIAKLAVSRAARKGTDPDDELSRTEKEFEAQGDMVFSFDSGSSPAVKQLRHKLLMANAGSMNLIMDEVGNNLTANAEAFGTFIELFDKGLTKQKITKVGKDNKRSEEIIGQTPANLLMFGVPSRLLDGGKTEDEMMAMLTMGYARRCFFGYVKSTGKRATRSAEQMFIDRTNTDNDVALTEIADRLENLADIINANKKLHISRETCILLNEYQLLCEERASDLSEQQALSASELRERNFKVLKLAGAYAFMDDSSTVTNEHVFNAIKLAEDSGEAFVQILSRDKNWVKLAKYFATTKGEVTQADLAEDLPYYRGSSSVRSDMLNMAISYGYKNNIIIKKSFSDGVEFLRGETLKETDLNSMVIAYSTDFTTDYSNETAPFDQLHKLTNAPGMHWTSHHLLEGYRNEDNCIPGFNLVVIDVEDSVSFSTAKMLLKDYKYLIYTTKRHTDEANRFRILLPTNYELTLDAKDYKEFMNNIYDWLPFAVDKGTNQRSRKWMSNPGTYEYNDGLVLDVLPFIPKTAKNEVRKTLMDSQQSMDNLERWIINNIGDGNRNNLLLRYAMILVDAGIDADPIRIKVNALNDKIPDKLSEAEILGTIMQTVYKAVAKR